VENCRMKLIIIMGELRAIPPEGRITPPLHGIKGFSEPL